MTDSIAYAPKGFQKTFWNTTYYVSSDIVAEFNQAPLENKLMLAAAVIQDGQIHKI
jgi:hypothetical protein